MIAFIVAHSTVLSGFGVALIDLLIAFIPSLKGNGLLHQLYVMLASQKAPVETPTIPPAA